jgi:hypothetical protein
VVKDMQDKKRDRRWEWLIAIAFVVFLSIICLLFGQKDTKSSNDTAVLNAKVEQTHEGLEVTNQENVDWTNCMVGLNGSNGFGLDNPPYMTHADISLPANETTLVPYSEITSKDGTIFDLSTHAINTAVVDCFRGTGDQRFWTGGSH